MIESVREGVVEMLHTRDGARVAMTCLWDGTPKARGKILTLKKLNLGNKFFTHFKLCLAATTAQLQVAKNYLTILRIEDYFFKFKQRD